MYSCMVYNTLNLWTRRLILRMIQAKRDVFLMVLTIIVGVFAGLILSIVN
jgi:hypothetical protein